MRLPSLWIALLASLLSATCVHAQEGGSMAIESHFWEEFNPADLEIKPDYCKLNLLKNPGLEAGMESWYGGGSLTVFSHAENQALQSCNTFEPAFQTIKALPNEPYTLRVFAKKDATASGTVSIKILNEEFIPIHQQFIDIQSEAYSLLKTTIIGSANTSFIEINIFQDGGEGCVSADDWCLSKGKKGEKYCDNAKFLSQTESTSTTTDIEPIKEEQRIKLISTLKALAHNPGVIAYWDMKTKEKLENKSKIFSILRDYVFSEAQ